MRVLALVPDAFGGYGGIAKYNRDLLRALCAYPACSQVVAIPRLKLMPNAAEPLPARLTYMTSGLGSIVDYLVTVLRVVHSSPRFTLFPVVTSICCPLFCGDFERRLHRIVE